MFVIFAGNAYAKDLAQGTLEFEGDTSFSSSSGSGDIAIDSTIFNITALYYVSPNIGVGLAWLNSDVKTDVGIGTDEVVQNTMAPIAGYNISLDPASSLQLYAGIILVGSFEFKTDGVTDAKGDITGSLFGGRYKRFVTDSVSVNAGITVTKSTFKPDGGGSADSDSTSLDIGFSVYF